MTLDDIGRLSPYFDADLSPLISATTPGSDMKTIKRKAAAIVPQQTWFMDKVAALTVDGSWSTGWICAGLEGIKSHLKMSNSDNDVRFRPTEERVDGQWVTWKDPFPGGTYGVLQGLKPGWQQRITVYILHGETHYSVCAVYGKEKLVVFLDGLCLHHDLRKVSISMRVLN